MLSLSKPSPKIRSDSSVDFSFSGDSLGDTSAGAAAAAAAAKHREIILAAKENQALRMLKCFVFGFLFLCMGFVSWGIYWYMSTSEINELHLQFHEDATKVLATLGTNMEHILEAMDAFTVSMISHARSTNQTWPFVVIPDFAVRAEKIRSLSGAVYINTYHFVEDTQRVEWENFTAKPSSHSWVNESIQLQENNPTNEWQTIWNFTLWDKIHGYDEFDKPNPGEFGTNRTGPYLPLWQIMPVIPVRYYFILYLQCCTANKRSSLCILFRRPRSTFFCTKAHHNKPLTLLFCF